MRMWWELPLLHLSLMVAFTSAIPLEMQYCFWFTTFLGKGSSSAFHLAFPTTIALTPQVRELVWGFCQLLSMSFPFTYSRIGKITTGWVQGPSGPTVIWT